MKKIISLILISIMLVSIAACNTPAVTTAPTTQTTATTDNPESPSDTTKESASKILSEAIDKFFKNDSMHAKITADLKISTNGVTSENEFSKELYGTSLSTSPVWKSISSSTVVGKAEESETYFKDGKYYVSKYGFNAEIANSNSAEEEYGWKKTFEVFLEKAPSDSYITYYRVNEDGTTEIRINTARKAVMFDELFDGIKESFVGEETEDVSVSCNDPIEKAVVIIGADGGIVKYIADIEFPITVSSGSQRQFITITTEAEATVENANGNVTVEAPKLALTEFVPTTAKDFNYSLAEFAYNKFLKNPDVDAGLYAYIGAQMSGVKVEVEMEGRFQGKDYMGETPVIRQRMLTLVSNTTQEADIYYADGYYYISTISKDMGINSRVKLSREEYEAENGESESNELFTFFGNRDVKESDIAHDSQTGITEIYFELYTSNFPIVFAESIEAAQKIIVGESEVTHSSVSSPQILVTLDDKGEISSYAVAYTLNLKFILNGKEIFASSYIYEETNINSTENVNVEVPSNLNSYVSSSEQT